MSPYLYPSATSIEGNDTNYVSAVGVSLEATEGVAGVTELQMILLYSRQGRFLNLHYHCGLLADNVGFYCESEKTLPVIVSILVNLHDDGKV